MQMTILQREDDVTHVVLSGRLDTTGVEAISQSFSAATGARERAAIVDLAEIDFLTSCGIALLITNCKRLMKAGRRMVLLNPRGMVESVLKISRVDKLMPFAGDLDEAVLLAGGVPTGPAASHPGKAGDQAEPHAGQAAAEAQAAVEGAVRLAIKNDVSELAGLSASISSFLEDHRVPQRAAYAVNLSIDELVTNVMRYAYVDDETHRIEVELAVEGEQVILRITDDGRPFDPRKGPALDLHAEEREIGGLGILLVLEMVDTLKYQRVGEKNCVEVRVHLYGEA